MTSKEPLNIAVREPPPPKPKRVYKTVSVGEEGGVYRVFLDGKSVNTPLRRKVETPKRALANALAAEWDAQDPVVDVETMPLMRLVSTVLDRVGPERSAHIAELMKYADADLLCYRAGHPPDLKARQQAVWQPVLDWLAGDLGIAFATVEGMMPHRQNPAAVAALKAALESLDDERLTALQACAAITNSLALSLALVHGRLAATEVFAAAVLDERYQMEKWGEDKHAVDRHKRMEADVLGIGVYLKLIG